MVGRTIRAERAEARAVPCAALLSSRKLAKFAKLAQRNKQQNLTRSCAEGGKRGKTAGGCGSERREGQCGVLFDMERGKRSKSEVRQETQN